MLYSVVHIVRCELSIGVHGGIVFKGLKPLNSVKGFFSIIQRIETFEFSQRIFFNNPLAEKAPNTSKDFCSIILWLRRLHTLQRILFNNPLAETLVTVEL